MRCSTTYPGSATLAGRPIHCDGERGHEGRCFNSFAMREWDHVTRTRPHGGRDWAGRRMACALSPDHRGRCRGEHGGTLR